MEKPDWFEMDKCERCAAVMAEPGLAEHWRFQDIPFATGMVQTSRVDEGYERAFVRASRGMDEVDRRIARGERPYLCGHCTSLVGLIANGARQDSDETLDNYLMFVSATDPKLIRCIQSHAERTNTELRKMQLSA